LVGIKTHLSSEESPINQWVMFFCGSGTGKGCLDEAPKFRTGNSERIEGAGDLMGICPENKNAR
jgi:hypothetical protein